MKYSVYFLRDNLNNLYIGQTNNLTQREDQQLSKSSKTAKFIQNNGEFQLVYREEYQTRLEAMRREKQLKGWTRAKKEALIAGDLDLWPQIDLFWGYAGSVLVWNWFMSFSASFLGLNCQ